MKSVFEADSGPNKSLYSEVVQVLYVGMSATEVEAVLGPAVFASEGGTVWEYPKDRTGRSVKILMVGGLVSWQFD